MTGSALPRTATVVGGGLAGSLAAVYLARAGVRVTLCELRPDPREAASPGASMNLGLSRRGLEALAAVGLEERIEATTIPMRGRVVHGADGRVSFQPYGAAEHQVIRAVQRNELNAELLDAAARLPGVELRFELKCVEIDRDGGRALFEHLPSGERVSVESDLIVGADGVHSTVRQSMQHGLRAAFQREYLDWGWRELTIPPGPGGAFRLERNAFHLWPRGRWMLFSHPNRDGSFTCSLVLPFEGAVSFEALATEAAALRFFRTTFPDLFELVPNLIDQFLANPVIDLVSVRTTPWRYSDRVVLLGDAAHAVFPFYAQGMNAAFEDCAELTRLLADSVDRGAALAEFERVRRPNTDALADISRHNFFELSDRVRSPWLRSRKRLEAFLHRLLGTRWLPLHWRVTHTTTPYARAVLLDRRQELVLAVLCAGAVTLALLAVMALT